MPGSGGTSILGHTTDRREDPGLLRGSTRFLADLEAEGALHLVLVRSSIAHGAITGIDLDAARAMPGIHSVLTAADLDARGIRSVGREPELSRPLLARDRVRFVGEPVAAILAESVAQGHDAAEAVVVDVDPLPAIVDVLDAVAPGAPVLFPDFGTNVVSGPEWRHDGDDDPFPDADVVIRQRIRHNRVAPVTMEPNGALAVPDADGGLTLWASTQSVFGVRADVAGCLRVDPESIRVRAPAVGGGFGAKGGVYPEQVLVAALALRTGRPVRWVETRTENLLGMCHGRGVGPRPDGRCSP